MEQRRGNEGDLEFWRLGHVSDEVLVAGLVGRVRAGRRALAELLAHLGEVEERRIHLAAGYGSMFEYCVKHLGLSEDEACRRIEVARLARRHTALFSMLAGGQVSMSVAALLKPHLDATNAPHLLAAVATCSTTRARELLAAWFPRPDVPTTIRKLPQPRLPSAALPFAAEPMLQTATAPSASSPSISTAAPALPSPVSPRTLEPRPPAPARIEPLAPARYKLQLTASAELKAKLELARDLLRHAVPSGDYAALIERALDLLITDAKKRRFGATSRSRTAGVKPPAETRSTTQPPATPANANLRGAADTAGPGTDAATSERVARMIQQGESATNAAMLEAPDARASCAVPRAARRIIAERDDVRCSWVSEDGRRCGARAWLEYDHHWPRGKGGPTSAEYLRLLCRAHNRFEAERVYGRGTIDRAIERARTGGVAAGDPRSSGSSGPVPGRLDPGHS